jgi:hypothetical protein
MYRNQADNLLYAFSFMLLDLYIKKENNLLTEEEEKKVFKLRKVIQKIELASEV